MMNAITFLLKEHQKVRQNLKLISKKFHRYSTKRRKFDLLCQDLLRHEKMEHRVWYPHFKNNRNLKKEVRHLLSEEKHAENAIKKIKALKNDKEWEKSFNQFKKEVEHHAHEEETMLFPNVEQILDSEVLKKIGKDMQAFRRKYNHKKN